MRIPSRPHAFVLLACLTLACAQTGARAPDIAPSDADPSGGVQSFDPSEVSDVGSESISVGATVAPHQDRIVFLDSAALEGREPESTVSTLRALGASTLYLVGVSMTEQGSQDPAGLRPELGGEAGLFRWVQTAREGGLDVLIDLELNHVDERSSLVRERPDWFHGLGPIRDYDDPGQIVFHDIEGTRDFAQELPEVSAFLIGAASSFIDRAPISGLGFQSARHVPTPFWAELVWAVQDAADVRIRTLATWLSGNPRMLARVLSEVGFSEVLDVPSHFALYETVCDRARPERLASVLYADRRYDDPTRLVTWLDHPSIPSAEERCGGDEGAILSALALQHGLRGRPSITERLARCESKDAECSARRSKHLRTLFELRAKHPVLFAGDSRLIAVGRAGLLLLRVGREEVATVAYNASSDEALVVPVPMGIASSTLLESYGMEVEGRRLSVPPGGTGIAVFRNPGTGALEWSVPTSKTIEISMTEVPTAAESVVLVGDHEIFGDWDIEKGLELRRDADGWKAQFDLPRGAAAELRAVAWVNGEELMEEHPRFIFVAHQRGSEALSWQWGVGP
ncbi:MAG: hypothetical protein AAFQ82_02785 [Myxococcota bacterium]